MPAFRIACDLIEPLRVPAVDRWVILTCGQGELASEHFVREENGGFRLRPAAFAKTLSLWEKEWSDANTSVALASWISRLTGFLREHSSDLTEASDGE
jgi:CRISPR/Cas system-associated endonuclease Cas1